MSHIIKFFSFIFLFLSFLFSSLLKIYFINVEEADSAFVITPNNYTMLIDGGDFDEFHDYGKMYILLLKNN